MLTNVYEYNKINLLTFSHNASEILSPLAKTAYLAIAQIFSAKISFFYQMFRSKSQKVKNGLKLNVLVTIFEQFLVENHIFLNYLHFN